MPRGGNNDPDEVKNVLKNMSKQQLWDFLAAMKNLIHQNHQQARQLLINNPALTRAIFETQIILGIGKNARQDAQPMMAQPPAAQFPVMVPPAHPMGMNGASNMGMQGQQQHPMTQPPAGMMGGPAEVDMGQQQQQGEFQLLLLPVVTNFG